MRILLNWLFSICVCKGKVGTIHNDNGGCKAATTSPLSPTKQHFIWWFWWETTAFTELYQPILASEKEKNNAQLYLSCSHSHFSTLHLSQPLTDSSLWNWFISLIALIFIPLMWCFHGSFLKQFTTKTSVPHTMLSLLCSIVIPPIWFFWDWAEPRCYHFICVSYDLLPVS